MPSLDFLKNKIEEKRKVKKKSDNLSGVDADKVDQIVEKMRKKYQMQGIEFQTVEGKLGELRGMIAEGKTQQLEVRKVEELQDYSTGTVKSIGKLYIKLRKILAPLSRIVTKMPAATTLSYFLFSANMRYSVKQYIAITVTVSFIAAIVVFFLSGVLLALSNLPFFWKFLLPIVLGGWFFFITIILMLIIPKQISKARGNAISIELPFALRHMSTELRSGIGLYRTLQAVAVSDYGVLSEEFAKTITEIEEGVETKDALTRMALRTQSRALRNALMHMVRALKTGGNISDIMNSIASDVSFELRMKTRDFAQRMNFFGVIYIFAAIWLPVMIAILGGIRNSALQGGMFSLDTLPLTPGVIALFYLAILPLVLVFLISYIMATQPKA
ncbi:MAG: type II secretion system F family protein [Candidatus Diapherotrites archaeon]|nr:type II secretion system F family protein [Candidatus Diapherotrites archaeon]